MKRFGSAAWNSSLREGKATVSTESRALENHPYTFFSRYGEKPGTNPEELLAAAHAACFTMSFDERKEIAMSTLQRISITALTAVVLGTVGASARELPRYEVTGFPISPLQMSVLKSGDIQEQSPTPMLTLNGMPASPHQIAVILGLCSVVWRSAPCFEGQITELARPRLENLGSTLLGVVPPCGFPAEQKSATTKRAPATLGCHPPMDKKTRFRVDL
jgi:hypothetical protein